MLKMTKQKIIDTMLLTGKISIPYIQNKFKLGYEEAKQICDGLKPIEKRNKYLEAMNRYLEKLK